MTQSTASMKSGMVVAALMAMAHHESAFNELRPKQKRTQKDDWDTIEKEYKLIQEKKSNLPSAQRRVIVAKWERAFKPTTRPMGE